MKNLRPESKKTLIWVLIALLTLLILSLLTPPPAQARFQVVGGGWGDFQPIVLKAAPNALKTYFYPTPIYHVPQEVLHWANWELGPGFVLNFYTYYFDPGGTAHVIGTEETKQFVFVVLDDTGQVGWIPLIQTDLQAWMLEGLPIIKISNMPDYSRYNTFLP